MSSAPVVVPPSQLVPRRSRRISRDRWFAFWLVLPTIITVIGVSIYPVYYAIRLSLRNYNPSFGMDLYVGLDNYRSILENPDFHKAIKVTARFAISSTLLSMLLGLGIALVLNHSFKGRGVLRSVILVPWAMSGTVVGVLWAWIYDGGYGTLNGVLYKFGVIDQYKAWLSSYDFGPILGPASLYFVVVAFVWNSAPMAALFILAALQAVPRNLYAAARMDGASAWQRFRYITLPWLRPMLLLVLILSSINGIMAFDLIYFLTKGGPGTATEVLSFFAYRRAFLGLSLNEGSAASFALLLVVLAMTIAFFALLEKRRKSGMKFG